MDILRPVPERPAGGEVKANLKELLRDPQNRPRQTFWEWLQEKLADFEGPDLALGGLADILLLFVVFWCVLTLIAILAHLAWTLSIYLRRPRTGVQVKVPSKQNLMQHSYEQLRDLSCSRAEAGDFRGAIGCLAVAMIKWLDEKKVLVYHESKTNREYVREFAKSCPQQPEFRRFLGLFDQTVYGHLFDENESYETLLEMMGRIQDHVNVRE